MIDDFDRIDNIMSEIINNTMVTTLFADIGFRARIHKAECAIDDLCKLKRIYE